MLEDIYAYDLRPYHLSVVNVNMSLWPVFYMLPSLFALMGLVPGAAPWASPVTALMDSVFVFRN